MPSKNYNGNNPLGRARIKSNGLDTNGALARVETQIGRLQPALSLQTGSLQLPNGRVQVPRRARRGGGGTAAGCIPWTPTVVNTSETEVPNYKIRLSPGTINGVINPGWNDLVNVTDPVAVDDLNYIIATVAFTSRQVTSITYSTSATIPSGGDLNPIAEESFPSQVKIILGTLVGTSACMVWTSNLTVDAVEVFKETIANPAANVKPYKSWYRFQISAATA